MKKIIAPICMALLVPCVAMAERVLVDGVAGYVNDHVITLGEVLSTLQPVKQRLVMKYKGDELREKLNAAYQAGLSNQVARYLILDAYTKRDAKLPEWVVEKRAAEIIHDNFNAWIERLKQDSYIKILSIDPFATM